MEQRFKVIEGGLCSLEPSSEGMIGGHSIPRSFHSREGDIEVCEVLDHWPSAGMVSYKIQTDAGGQLIIAHHLRSDSWRIIKWLD